MKAVGIHDFSIICSMGSQLTDIWNKTENSDILAMEENSSYLNGEKTYIGRVKSALPHLEEAFSSFDYRANRLLKAAMQSIYNKYIQLVKSVPAHRIGVILGTSTAGIDSLEKAIPYYDIHKKWPKSYEIHHQRMGGVSEFLAQYLKVTGPVMSVSTACSSSAKAMISAQRWINAGVCDVVITGGVDVLCELTIKGFNSLGAISNDRCQPFSQNRKGINIGEAAALFIFKKETDRLNMLAGGESSDAYHISAPDPTGKGAYNCMQSALNNARLDASEIDYLNLHGTATLQNDAMESLAVNQLFDHAVNCSSTKSLTGHTLGAAGALEVGLSALSMSDFNVNGNYIPHIYDEKYDSRLAPLNLIKKNNQLGVPETIMSNSFAFGGSNASIVLSKSNKYV